MRRINIIIIIFFLISTTNSFAVNSSVQSDKNTIEVTGVGRSYEAALIDARARLLEAALGVLIDSETISESKQGFNEISPRKIRQSVAGHVLNEQVINQILNEKGYSEVTITADIFGFKSAHRISANKIRNTRVGAVYPLETTTTLHTKKPEVTQNYLLEDDDMSKKNISEQIESKPFDDYPLETYPLEPPLHTKPELTEEYIFENDDINSRNLAKQVEIQSFELNTDEVAKSNNLQNVNTFYTSLIIDAVGKYLVPDRIMKIFDESGGQIYGFPASSSYKQDPMAGLAGFVLSLEDAKSHERAGNNPLIVRAIDKIDDVSVVIKQEDADFIKNISKDLTFLDEARVIIIL